MDTPTIISLVLFSVSELLAVIPIPASGVLHSLVIGIKNSFQSKKNADLELGVLIDERSDIKSVIDKFAKNPEILQMISKLLSNPNTFAQVNAIVNNPQINYITTLLKDNPQLTSEIKLLIESKLSK